jgi:hypothetical protein
MRNPCHGGHDDCKGHSLSPKGPSPKAFGSVVCDACFPRRFSAPGYVVKYNGKTNPSDWLEDYHLSCRVGGVNDDLFLIQFLPLYLADSVRAWLDHLPRNIVSTWDDL